MDAFARSTRRDPFRHITVVYEKYTSLNGSAMLHQGTSHKTGGTQRGGIFVFEVNPSRPVHLQLTNYGFHENHSYKVLPVYWMMWS